MTTHSSKIEFYPTSPFYDMVNAYMVGLSGLLILSPQVHIDLRGLPVRIASTEVPEMKIQPHELRVRFQRGDFKLGSITDALARLLVNWAYERAKDAYSAKQWTSLLNSHAELEFLRHLRNAASHGAGLWNFKPDEPRRPAQWRGRVLTAALNGHPMWDANLQPGDLLLLLSDIEKMLILSPPPSGW